jgi:enoyl-CoA hydratase/carnithine racemase
MPIRMETRDAVAWATIERPEVLNAFDIAHLDQLLSVFRQAGEDDEIAVLVLTGSGRAFSVGADIKAMDRMNESEFARMAGLFQALVRAARGLDKPVLGAINGLTIGGGLEIALMCDLRIAARSARFTLPDAQLGFSPTGGLTYLLPRIVGLGRAMHLLLTCESLDAAEAERIGLVTEVVEDEALADRVAEIADRLTGCPRLGLRSIKRSLNAACDAAFEASLSLEQAYDAANYANPETRAGLAAFLDSRRNG